MAKDYRLDQIVSLVDERGYLSVIELSELLDVSEMTIRRDLARLEEEKRLHRTYGGAASRRGEPIPTEVTPADKSAVTQVDQVDVLIATPVNPYYDRLLLDRVSKKAIPVIAESVSIPGQSTLVAVDNYQASLDLGRWAGRYLSQHGFETAFLLDLSFHLSNTQTRSRGFLDGVHETCPDVELVLSIDAQSRAATAYQIARDALTVHPQINLIFAINDSTALGAIRACRDLNIPPQKMVVVTFGLEGDTLKNALMEIQYCKAGLAMFPEIVAQGCIDAAVAAYNHQPLPHEYVTPYVVLTSQTLPDYYTQTSSGWQLNWEAIHQEFRLPPRLETQPRSRVDHGARLPATVGLVVPFSEHEWYKELTRFLQENAAQYGFRLEIIDADQNIRDEIETRRRAIAAKAASLVNSGDVVIVDGGPIAEYLAEELKKKSNLTVITNSMVVLNTLNPAPGIVLISTGGALRYSSQVLVGPTAESTLKELRADKLFLMVGGITFDFGLSHTNISEVTIKQAMIRSSHEVILLADHTSFSTESIIQVAPLSVVDKLITDDALQPKIRLEISKLGIQLLLA
ncbi:MAG TPA: substrate-binding domain-containing protein [Anaerolineaceae bacterium]|nr:substrate-binding domain-containing protein [Anaerolineaceae bacterium]